MADRLAHVPDLVLAALVDLDLEDGSPGGPFEHLDLGRSRFPALDENPRPQAPGRGFVHLPPDMDDIPLGDFVPGMGQPVGQFPVAPEAP